MNRRLYFLFESEKNFTGCSNFAYCRQEKAQINVKSARPGHPASPFNKELIHAGEDMHCPQAVLNRSWLSSVSFRVTQNDDTKAR
jgi:hypothetical protein